MDAYPTLLVAMYYPFIICLGTDHGGKSIFKYTTQVDIIRQAVNHNSILPIQLKAKGGQAIWLYQD